MRCLDIYIERAQGGHFETALARLPEAYKFERYERTTQVRRTQTAWLVYRFIYTHIEERLPMLQVAEEVKRRHNCQIEYWEFYLNRVNVHYDEDGNIISKQK